jgi:uncharacterized protein (TIGR02118 family)
MKISILYPNKPGGRFDWPYYIETHMPRSIELLSGHPGFNAVSVERGAGALPPGNELAYIAMCHFEFDSLDAFLGAFGPHAAELQSDMANYTDIEPVIQFNDVVIARKGIST